MIIETGRVVAVEEDSLWVETIQRSTCGSCSAEKGCGQSLMAKMSGHTSYLRILLEGRDPSRYQLGDEIRIGIPEDIIVRGSMLVYMVPLLGMLLFSGLAHQWWNSEGLTTLAALSGLAVGALVVAWRSSRTRNDSRLQPVLVDDRRPLVFTHD